MNPINALLKGIYWPICRAYSRHLGDRPADAILKTLCTPQFLIVNRYWPNFAQPRSFGEKVWCSMLYDRDPIFTLISDKLAVRDYVASKVGEEYLVPLLWSGSKPTEIPYDKLPSKFVIKMNHGCEYNIFVKDKSEVNREKVKRQLKKWIGTNFGNDTFLGIAWGYRNIKPLILIESFLEENGRIPPDYKFWCFSGRAEFISLHFDRFKDHATLSFDRRFEPGGLSFNLPIFHSEYKRPSNWNKMLEVAEALSEGFDFMRVDLYTVRNNIFFGELTPYPGGVSTRFEPKSLDLELGAKWNMK